MINYVSTQGYGRERERCVRYDQRYDYRYDQRYDYARMGDDVPQPPVQPEVNIPTAVPVNDAAALKANQINAIGRYNSSIRYLWAVVAVCVFMPSLA